MKSLAQVILSTVFLLTLFSGCSKQPTPSKAGLKTDPTLPIVSINGHLTDMNAVAFEWKKIEDPRVQGIFIYRNSPEDNDTKLRRIATVDNRLQTHFTDQAVIPGTEYDYAFTSFSGKNTQSKPSKRQKVKTLPLLASVSFFQTIDKMPRSAKLIWRPHTNPMVESYIIERKTTEDDDEWHKIDVVKNRLSAEYIDTDLEDDATYHYRVRVKTFDGLISEPTEVVTVTTKPLPESIEDIHATQDKVKDIRVTWEPQDEEETAYYKVYRTTALDQGFEYYAKVKEPFLLDKTGKDGALYYYKVTAVDMDGLEGLQGSVAAKGTTISRPKRPLAVMAYVVEGDRLKLQWKNADQRTVSYTIIKSTKESWVNTKVQEITNIKGESYIDKDVSPDTPYSYQVVAVDKLGLRSDPTNPVEISFPEQ